MKYYLIYIVSYFLMSLVSIVINKLFELEPRISPNIFVQIICAGYLVKNVCLNNKLSMIGKAVLPLLFGVVAVIFFVVMIAIFPEWKDQHKPLTTYSILIMFGFNYLVGLVTTLYVSKGKA